MQPFATTYNNQGLRRKLVHGKKVLRNVHAQLSGKIVVEWVWLSADVPFSDTLYISGLVKDGT